jgi:hypothetical protein
MTAKAHITRYESVQEPLDEEERTLMDPDTWDWEHAYEIEPSPDPHLIFDIRLSGEDLDLIEPAAVARGMTIGALLRFAGLKYARRRSAKEAANGA